MTRIVLTPIDSTRCTSWPGRNFMGGLYPAIPKSVWTARPVGGASIWHGVTPGEEQLQVLHNGDTRPMGWGIRDQIWPDVVGQTRMALLYGVADWTSRWFSSAEWCRGLLWGQPGGGQSRAAWLANLERFVHPSAWLVLAIIGDDSSAHVNQTGTGPAYQGACVYDGGQLLYWASSFDEATDYIDANYPV